MKDGESTATEEPLGLIPYRRMGVAVPAPAFPRPQRAPATGSGWPRSFCFRLNKLKCLGGTQLEQQAALPGEGLSRSRSQNKKRSRLFGAGTKRLPRRNLEKLLSLGNNLGVSPPTPLPPILEHEL